MLIHMVSREPYPPDIVKCYALMKKHDTILLVTFDKEIAEKAGKIAKRFFANGSAIVVPNINLMVKNVLKDYPTAAILDKFGNYYINARYYFEFRGKDLE